MKNQVNAIAYVCPEANVIEIKNEGVLCESGGSQTYESGTWKW